MKPARDTLLGLVFFSVIAGLIAATVFLSDRIYGSTTPIHIFFDQALGLRKGDPVMIAGVNSGFVNKIELLEGKDIIKVDNPDPRLGSILYRVKVQCKLRQADIERTVFRDDYKIRIEYASVLGGRVVSLDPGEKGNEIKLDANTRLFGTVRRDPLAALSELIDENRTNIKETIVEIRDTFRDIRTGGGILGKIINDKPMADKFEKIVSDIERTTDNLAQGRGALGKAINDPEMAAQLSRIVANINEISDKLNRPEGVLGKLINDTAWTDQVNKIISDISNLTGKLNSTEGSLGKLINSNEAHDKLIVIEDNITKLIDNINNSNGLLGRIINDKEMGDDAKQFVHDIKETFATINRGEGTLGKLIKDDQLIRQIERLVRQLSRSIEDAREAAPIATFSSVLFGAF